MSKEEQELWKASQELLSYVIETAPEKYNKVLQAMAKLDRSKQVRA